MKLVNLTPHDIVIRTNSDGVIGDITVPPSGVVARVTTTPGQQVRAYPYTIYSSPTFGEVQGVPPASDSEDLVYIVSSMVLSHPSVKNRSDVVAPGTGPQDGAIRDEKGRIVAVTRLIAAST